MKIQCAVCNKDEASVYCSADDAALCSGCDHRVHHANKLAGKHSRFSLIQPSPKESPLCDICQEKRAFLFCQQDRAILCKDCDVPIHKVNEHTQKHNRFLLTGVKLSATSSLYSPPSPTANSTDSAAASAADLVPDHHRQTKPAGPIKPQKSPPAAAATPPPPPPPAAAIFNSNSSNQTPPVNKTSNSNTNSSSGKTGINNQAVNGSGHGSTTSSISEYLIETLPGWHVEDFLDSSPLFLKGGDMDVMPFWDGDLLVEGNMNTWSPETMGMWVPQAPPPSLPPAPPPPPSSNYMGGSYGGGGGGGGQLGPKELLVFGTKHNNNNMKSSRKWRPDDGNCFTVPQISPPSSTASKRSRTFWH